MSLHSIVIFVLIVNCCCCNFVTCQFFGRPPFTDFFNQMGIPLPSFEIPTEQFQMIEATITTNKTPFHRHVVGFDDRSDEDPTPKFAKVIGDVSQMKPNEIATDTNVNLKFKDQMCNCYKYAPVVRHKNNNNNNNSNNNNVNQSKTTPEMLRLLPRTTTIRKGKDLLLI